MEVHHLGTSTLPIPSPSLPQKQQQPEGGAPAAQECAGCLKPIVERYMLKALDVFWHEKCLKCSCCDCRLDEVGKTCYSRANLILCKRDYLRLFGVTGHCSACSKVIPAFEMVMKAHKNVYHLECFACQQCNHRFCVGDRFYLRDGKVLCEYDYEERMVFARMAYTPTTLAHLRKRVGSIQPNEILGLKTRKESSLFPPTNGASYSSPAAASSRKRTDASPSASSSLNDDSSSGYGSPDSMEGR